MANLLYFDGTDYVEVPEEEAEKAEASGLKRQVLMISPEGESVAVPIEESTTALKQGLKLPGVEAPKLSTPKPTSTAEAAALGAFSGYVPGGQFLIEKTAGAFGVPEDVTKQYTAQVRKEHPVVSTGIEIGSALTSPVSVGGTILKAGTRITPKLAALLTAAEKSGAVGKVATSAAKGAFIGATDTATEAALSAKEGERLKAAKEGAIIGAAGGAVLGGIGGAISAKTEKLKPAATKTEMALVGIEDEVNKFGKRPEEILQLAQEEKLIPRVGQGYPDLVKKVDKKVTEAGDALDSLYDEVDALTPEKVSVPDTLQQFQEHFLQTARRTEGTGLAKQVDPIVNRLDGVNREIDLLDKYAPKRLSGMQDSINKIETRNSQLKKEIDQLTELSPESSPIRKANAQINLLQDKIDTIEAGEKISARERDLIQIWKSNIDALNEKILMHSDEYPELVKRQKELLSNNQKLDSLHKSFIRGADEAELAFLNKKNKLSKEQAKLNQQLQDSLLKDEYRDAYKSMQNIITEIQDSDPTAAGFTRLREIKQQLFRQAKEAPRAQQEAYYKIASQFDAFLKNRVKSISPEVGDEFIKRNDRLSKLISLQENIYKKAGREIESTTVPLHSAAWAAYYFATKRAGRGLAAATPNIKSPQLTGTAAAAKHSLGEIVDWRKRNIPLEPGQALRVTGNNSNNK